MAELSASVEAKNLNLNLGLGIDYLLELEDLDVGVALILNESNLVYAGDNINEVDKVPVVKVAR